MKRGEIWLVNFDPSVGHEYQKVRPALIIESNTYLPLGDLVTVVPISSQIQKSGILDVLIPKNPDNRLMDDSLAKPAKSARLITGDLLNALVCVRHQSCRKCCTT